MAKITQQSVSDNKMQETKQAREEKQEKNKKKIKEKKKRRHIYIKLWEKCSELFLDVDFVFAHEKNENKEIGVKNKK